MELKEALGNIYNAAKQEFGIENTPKLYLRQDTENAQNILGKTAYYSPGDQSIIIFITNRHDKDICRSFAHELICINSVLGYSFNVSKTSWNLHPGQSTRSNVSAP